MIEIGMLFLLALGLVSGFWMYRSMSRSKDISYYESETAAEFAARAHKLISDGVKIDQMAYSFDKHSRHLEWVDNLHLYMDDYEAAVADKIPRNSDIKSYAGIRLVVSDNRSTDLTQSR